MTLNVVLYYAQGEINPTAATNVVDSLVSKFGCDGVEVCPLVCKRENESKHCHQHCRITTTTIIGVGGANR